MCQYHSSTLRHSNQDNLATVRSIRIPPISAGGTPEVNTAVILGKTYLRNLRQGMICDIQFRVISFSPIFEATYPSVLTLVSVDAPERLLLLCIHQFHVDSRAFFRGCVRATAGIATLIVPSAALS